MFPRNNRSPSRSSQANKNITIAPFALPAIRVKTPQPSEPATSKMSNNQHNTGKVWLYGHRDHSAPLIKTPLFLDAVHYDHSNQRRKTSTLLNVEEPRMTVDALQFLHKQKSYPTRNKTKAQLASPQEINDMLGRLVSGKTQYRNWTQYNAQREKMRELWGKNPYQNVPAEIPPRKKGQKNKTVCFKEPPSSEHRYDEADTVVAPPPA